MGAEASAARAGRELTRDAQFAREALTNAEIGLPYVHQPRTVNYHLHKVFTKLGIRSRAHLDRGAYLTADP